MGQELQAAATALSENEFTRIEEAVGKACFKIRQGAEGKSVTLFLGNTGSGKSTTLNILQQYPLTVASDGTPVLKDEDLGLQIGGGDSVTSEPQYIVSDKLGVLFDLPGFGDTGGAEPEIRNTLFIRELLRYADQIKLALVVSKDEFRAGRGDQLKRVVDRIGLFPKSLLDSSLLLILTKVGEKKLTSEGELKGAVFEGYMKGIPKDVSERFSLLRSQNKIAIIPECEEEEDLEILQGEYRELLRSKLDKLPYAKASNLTLSRALTTESKMEVEKYFKSELAKQLHQMKTEDWSINTLTSEEMERGENEYKKTLQQRIDKNAGVRLLRGLAEDIFTNVIREDFRGSFKTHFGIAVERLKSIEAAKRAEAARIEKEAAEKREKEAQALSEKEATERAKAEKQAAAEREKTARAEREAANARARALAANKSWRNKFHMVGGIVVAGAAICATGGLAALDLVASTSAVRAMVVGAGAAIGATAAVVISTDGD